MINAILVNVSLGKVSTNSEPFAPSMASLPRGLVVTQKPEPEAEQMLITGCQPVIGVLSRPGAQRPH